MPLGKGYDNKGRKMGEAGNPLKQAPRPDRDSRKAGENYRGTKVDISFSKKG